jgi:hypothetical protein
VYYTNFSNGYKVGDVVENVKISFTTPNRYWFQLDSIVRIEKGWQSKRHPHLVFDLDGRSGGDGYSRCVCINEDGSIYIEPPLLWHPV